MALQRLLTAPQVDAAPNYASPDGLTGYSYQGGSGPIQMTHGLDQEGKTYYVDPATGKVERAFQGPGGQYYRESDLVAKYGSLDAAARLAGEGGYQQTIGRGTAAEAPEVSYGVRGWGVQPSQGRANKYARFIPAAIGAALTGGAGLAAFAEGAGEVGADSLLAGGGEVGSGYAASAPGWWSGSGAIGTGVGADAVTGGVGTDALASEGALGRGISQGATGASGLSAGSGTAGISAGSASGALAPGYFAGETLYPVIGGTTAGVTGAAAAVGGGSLISRLLNGTATADDYLNAAGRVAPSVLGAIASNRQAGDTQALADRFATYGAPSRARYEASMAPGFDPSTIPGYSGAVDTASKSLLARLSATGGNPYGNPGGLIDANKQIIAGTALPAVQEYQRLNAGTGFGATLNSAGSLGQNAITQQGNVYNAIGAGINDAINPPKSLAEQLAELRKSGISTQYSL